MGLPPGVKHWEGPPLEAWRPWSPQEACRQLRGVGVGWCVVGGFAIDLFLAEATRAHEDLEIAILRGDFPVVRDRLAPHALYVVGDGEVHALPPSEVPPLDRHQTWVHDADQGVWRMDVMLEPGDADTWVCRRDESIRVPRARMIALTSDGIPYLRPEGVLLYKAKASRPKDEADLAAVLPRLDVQARSWLATAIERAHPGHPWRDRLRSAL